jgi:hypothetical protein
MAEHVHAYNTIQKMTMNAKRIHIEISLPERSNIDATSARCKFNNESDALITLYFPTPLFSVIPLLHLQPPSLNAHTAPTLRSHMALNTMHYSHCDIILPLPSHVVDSMIDNGIHMFPRPWLYFGPIPPQIRRVWIYEDDAEGITVMLTLDHRTLPNRLYFITNPLYADVMGSQYNFHRYQIPKIAPFHILRRFRDHLMRIW